MVVLGSLITFGVCGPVLAFGRQPERAAALLVVLGLAAALALQTALGFHRQLPILLADIGLAGGFAFLTTRYRRMWLAGVSLMLIALLVAHAALAQAPSPLFSAAVNGLNLAALGVLAAGALAEARMRHLRSAPFRRDRGMLP